MSEISDETRPCADCGDEFRHHVGKRPNAWCMAMRNDWTLCQCDGFLEIKPEEQEQPDGQISQ